MKVSLNLAQYYSNVDLKAIPRDELLQRIGAQLGAIEEVIDWAPKFEGAAIVKVVSCEKHPNADKLNVCRVDDGGKNQQVERGEDGLIQVVCGAPNVHAGMYAIWLAPGVTVPNTRDSDPFVLGARELRGVISNGMMASAHELGISEDHSGIVEVTAEDAGKEPVPGEPLVNYFGLDDLVIDCENKMFTHRPDCFGNLGVARELAGINGLKFQSPEWYLKPETTEQSSDLRFIAKNELPELVSRFVVQAVEGVTVNASPMWMQAALARVGIKPINNIVDKSNYYMHVTAQPTHAFDYDKIKALSTGEPVLEARFAREGETLTLLGGKTINLNTGDIVIATDQQPVALAGILGGAETEVDSGTKNILIECATFDMYTIRRSSMRHGLFTDASSRFNKGQSPLQNIVVLDKLVTAICSETGAKAGECFDSSLNEEGQVSISTKPYPMRGPEEIRLDFINSRLGSQLTSDEIIALLENVEISAYNKDEDTLFYWAPFWRMDIECAEDVVEEVGRLYGFDKLPVTLPARPAKPTALNQLFELKKEIRTKLKAAGANEVLTYSFVHGDLMKKTGTEAEKWAFHLRNALSPSLQYYRTALMPSLLDKVHMNIKAGAGSADNEFAIFEISKVHVKGHNDADELPLEFERLALAVTADEKTAKTKYQGAAYYQALDYLKTVLEFEPELIPLETNEYPVTSSFQPGRAAMIAVNGEVFGVVGEFNANATKSLKLPAHAAGFEVELTKLLESNNGFNYRPLSAFPKIEQDLTLEVDSSKSYAELEQQLRTAINSSVTDHGYLYELSLKDIFQGEDSPKKRFTFRISLNHPEKTMKTDEVSALVNTVAHVLESDGAVRI